MHTIILRIQGRIKVYGNVSSIRIMCNMVPYPVVFCGMLLCASYCLLNCSCMQVYPIFLLCNYKLFLAYTVEVDRSESTQLKFAAFYKIIMIWKYFRLVNFLVRNFDVKRLSWQYFAWFLLLWTLSPSHYRRRSLTLSHSNGGNVFWYLFTFRRLRSANWCSILRICLNFST